MQLREVQVGAGPWAWVLFENSEHFWLQTISPVMDLFFDGSVFILLLGVFSFSKYVTMFFFFPFSKNLYVETGN